MYGVFLKLLMRIAEDHEVLYMLRLFERMITFRKSLHLAEPALPLRPSAERESRFGVRFGVWGNYWGLPKQKGGRKKKEKKRKRERREEIRDLLLKERLLPDGPGAGQRDAEEGEAGTDLRGVPTRSHLLWSSPVSPVLVAV